jgi:hypothetical protein
MIAPLCTLVLLAPAALGVGHHAPVSGFCNACGIEPAAVMAEVTALQTCPRWRDRDRAAKALRRFDWNCHPVVVDALLKAMLHDCEEEVREEAAESLAKLSPCLPSVHEALERTARCDPDHSTRKWARRGLANLASRCEGPCGVCGPAPVVTPPPVVSPAPYAEPALVPPGAPTPAEPQLSPTIDLRPLDTPPADLPATAPDRSPFSVEPADPTLPPLTRPVGLLRRINVAPRLLLGRTAPADRNRGRRD